MAGAAESFADVVETSRKLPLTAEDAQGRGKAGFNVVQVFEILVRGLEGQYVRDVNGES